MIELGKRGSCPSVRNIVHPHPAQDRDATDRDQAPGGFDVIRKCFWLNQPIRRDFRRERGPTLHRRR